MKTYSIRNRASKTTSIGRNQVLKVFARLGERSSDRENQAFQRVSSSLTTRKLRLLRRGHDEICVLAVGEGRTDHGSKMKESLTGLSAPKVPGGLSFFDWSFHTSSDDIRFQKIVNYPEIYVFQQ